MKIFFIISILFFISILAAYSQPNYDESKVPSFRLPPLLIDQNGNRIATADAWVHVRRPEILKMLQEQEYGKVPEKQVSINYKILREVKGDLGGKADMKEVEMDIEGNGKTISVNLLIYLPANAAGPVPVFLGCNFNGNQTVYPDPNIDITKNWVSNDPMLEIKDNKTNEISRGSNTSRYPILRILSRGYGFATFYYGDIDPDYDGGFKDGIQPLFYKPGQTKPTDDEWGAIGAWAWGLSRAMDYLENDPGVDPHKVIVFGHSRLGKTALWAGAEDQRFAMVISNESGCGGAALSKRKFGETVAAINKTFPYWFCTNFKKYNNKEQDMPFDQHMLIALIAPRPVYVASAVNDQWSDPKGEFLSLYYASEVYNLLGPGGLKTDEMPPPAHPIIQGNEGYHIRPGGHDLTYYDWERFMDFADLTLK